MAAPHCCARRVGVVPGQGQVCSCEGQGGRVGVTGDAPYHIVPDKLTGIVSYHLKGQRAGLRRDRTSTFCSGRRFSRKK